MAITIEGFTVVVKLSRARHLLESNALVPPNSMALADEHLWKCSFMTEVDACKFLQSVEQLGLNTIQGPDSDAVLVSEFNHSIEPYCEWLRIGVWEKAVIAWMEGTEPKSVVARQGWDPKVGSGLFFQEPSSRRDLEFLRLDGHVEVYLNKKTGEEVHIGRTSTPVEGMFTTASRTINQYLVAAGQPALTGDPAREVKEAVAMLGKVLDEVPRWWNAQWFYGKGQLALGNYAEAYGAFRKAFELEKTVEAIPRELGGVCLELGKFEEAVSVAEAAVSLEPDNAEALGNLALSYLMAGRYEPAGKAIRAALKLSADDKINQTIARILDEISDGLREAPHSLRDLSKPLKPKKRKFLGISW